jgi:hypothetical protein
MHHTRLSDFKRYLSEKFYYPNTLRRGLTRTVESIRGFVLLNPVVNDIAFAIRMMHLIKDYKSYIKFRITNREELVSSSFIILKYKNVIEFIF